MTKTTEQVKEEFLYPTPPLNPDSDKSFLDIAQTNNLNNFVTHLQYISSMVIGGKLSVDDSYKEVKKLYKSWKSSHKSLQGSWFV
jgi:hypothetical protein